MPTWSTSLPPERHNMGYSVVRTPDAAPLHLIATSARYVCVDTHWWRGRTVPCERVQDADQRTIDDTPCQACMEKQPYRSHVYLSAINPKTGQHVLFECTAQAAIPIDEYLRAHGTTRGMILHASRAGGKRNSKVLIQTASANQARVALPEPPDLCAALTILWRLPRTALPAPDATKTKRPRLQHAALNRMNGRNPNGSATPTDPTRVGEILDKLATT